MMNASALDSGLHWLEQAYSKSDILLALVKIAADDMPQHDTESEVACSGVIAAGHGGASWKESAAYLSSRLAEDDDEDETCSVCDGDSSECICGD